MARAGFDSVTLDMQHGLFDEGTVAQTLMALGDAKPKRYVRPLANEAGDGWQAARHGRRR